MTGSFRPLMNPPANPAPPSAEPLARRDAPRRRQVLLAVGGLALLASGVRVGKSTLSAPSASDLPPTPAARAASAPRYYVHDGPGAIALSMDDGPDRRYTPQVLQILQSHGITATFNMVGREIAGNLPLVREVAAAGHTITNHTWDHTDLVHCTYLQVADQIDRCNQALAEAGQHPTIFRAPYGNWSATVFQACAAYGLTPVDWSVDPHDWARPGVPAIVANVLRHTRAGSIILAHDGGGDRSQTVTALRIFIPELLQRGYHFVTV